MSRTFESYCANVYSDNGEDGILREIFARLGISCGFCVDVGASGGERGSNTRAFLDLGWDGILIDQNPTNEKLLRDAVARLPGRIEVVREVVGDGSNGVRLDQILAAHAVKEDFDLLSVDVDSSDLEIWEGLSRYRPKVVVLEVNSSVPLGIRQRHGNGRQGASFTSALESARVRGYTLTCHVGNAIFVEDRFVLRLELSEEERLHPEMLFNYNGPSLQGGVSP